MLPERGESDHFLAILENVEMLDILEILSVQRLLSSWPKKATKHESGLARVGGGQNGPKWTILGHFGLANAKIRFGIGSL